MLCRKLEKYYTNENYDEKLNKNFLPYFFRHIGFGHE